MALVSKTLRIFSSSTFSDLKDERNAQQVVEDGLFRFSNLTGYLKMNYKTHILRYRYEA